MASLTQEQIKVLEQSRQRLVQLTRSLSSLITSLNQGDPFPQWSSLQSQASIISNNLISVSEHLADNGDLLSSLVAYPGPEYPGRTQANILEQLLRTKLDPRVEDWVARGRVAGTESAGLSAGVPAIPAPGAIAASAAAEQKKPLSEAELVKLWEWAPIEANEEARRRNWGGNFTLEEKEAGIQNVVTGLKRQLEDDDGESDEEEGEEEDEADENEMDVVGVHRKSGGGAGFEFDIVAHHPHTAQPVVPLGHFLTYMSSGQLS